MARLLATLGILVISFSAIFVRLAATSPTTSAFFRVAYALPVLGVLWYVQRHRDQRTLPERRLAFIAGIFLGLDMALFHTTIDLIGAGLATVLGNTQVIFVGFAAWLTYGEKPKREALAILPLVVTGLLLISGVGQSGAYGANPSLGVILGVLTGLTYGVFLFLARASNRSLSPAVGPLFDATIGAVLTCVVIGLFFGDLDFTPHWPAHGWLLTLALGSQVFGWSLIQHAMPRLPALETSVMLLGQPMLTVCWGYLLFAESLSPLQWGGVALVVGGIGVMSIRGSLGVEKKSEGLDEESLDEGGLDKRNPIPSQMPGPS